MLWVILVFRPMDGDPFCFHKPVDGSSCYNNVFFLKTIYVPKESKNEVFVESSLLRLFADDAVSTGRGILSTGLALQISK